MQAFGLNPEIVIKFLKEILKSNKVVSFDIAEVSPRFDHDKRTAKLAAIIVYAIINGLIENKQKQNKKCQMVTTKIVHLALLSSLWSVGK